MLVPRAADGYPMGRKPETPNSAFCQQPIKDGVLVAQGVVTMQFIELIAF